MISFFQTFFGCDISTNGIACKHYEWAYSQTGYPKGRSNGKRIILDFITFIIS